VLPDSDSTLPCAFTEGGGGGAEVTDVDDPGDSDVSVAWVLPGLPQAPRERTVIDKAASRAAWRVRSKAMGEPIISLSSGMNLLFGCE
jgi:hypothetical protein